jgi:hypothetical protein
MSERPPKPEPKEEEFVFVSSADRYPHIYDWDREWNPDMVGQCKDLFRRMGWKRGVDLMNQDKRLVMAFDDAEHRLQKDAIENIGDSEEGRKSISALRPDVRKGLVFDLSVAAGWIFQGQSPKAFSPLELGTLLEQMVGYLENKK